MSQPGLEGGGIHLVLVGGGHTHVQVLRAWIRKPMSGVSLTVLADEEQSVYSGMIPGVMAGQYAPAAAAVDLRPLAAAAGARLVVASVVQVEARERRLLLQGGASLSYDYASLNIGSVTAGLDVEGVATHAIATRPIASFVQRMQDALDKCHPDRSLHVVVVGGGAAGIELAFALSARLSPSNGTEGGWPQVRISLVGDAPDPLPGGPARLSRLVKRALLSRHIHYLAQGRVVSVQKDAVVFNTGERLAANLIVWATGAAAPPLIRLSQLPRDERGFLLTKTSLQVQGTTRLFAAGDCAVMQGWEQLPRAGVYAVRAGPVLFHNLQACLRGERLRAFHPQARFLSIINFCDGRAVAYRGSFVAQGRWAWALKDWIDRGWVQGFRLQPEA